MKRSDFENNELSRKARAYEQALQVAETFIRDMLPHFRGGDLYKANTTLDELKAITEHLRRDRDEYAAPN